MTPRVERYLDEAAERHQTTREAILSDARETAEVAARREVMQRLHDDGFSMMRIGRWLGRHHTTVLHHLRKVAA